MRRLTRSARTASSKVAKFPTSLKRKHFVAGPPCLCFRSVKSHKLFENLFALFSVLILRNVPGSLDTRVIIKLGKDVAVPLSASEVRRKLKTASILAVFTPTFL